MTVAVKYQNTAAELPSPESTVTRRVADVEAERKRQMLQAAPTQAQTGVCALSKLPFCRTELIQKNALDFQEGLRFRST